MIARRHAIALALLAQSALAAQTPPACSADAAQHANGSAAPESCKPARGKMLDESRAVTSDVPANAERAGQPVKAPSAAPSCAAGAAPAGDAGPFRITIDGAPLAAGPASEADRQRCVDVALAKADVQIKYDALAVAPALNVWIARNAAVRGEPVTFLTYSNYLTWITKAEVRIFAKGQESTRQPLAVVPVTPGGQTAWTPPPDAPSELQFVLRVYDARERFDETAMKPLGLVVRRTAFDDLDSRERESLTGYGEDSRFTGNIPVRGGTVTISGRDVPAGRKVVAMGLTVPVDKRGRFVVRQIVPAGPQAIDVSLLDEKGEGPSFRRNLTIPDDDWFYVALADLTVGRNTVRGPAELVTNDTAHYGGSHYVEGRGAFYLKGKIKGEYLLTMSADTREQPLRDLFSNFSSKDPRYLLRSIDPNAYYPVYGDDSTIVDDAPTQGKFYVRLQRGDSHVMWGNFKTTWTGTELTQYSRGLYGANLVWHSDETTRHGAKRSSVSLFAADPGTAASREDFRSTGGSLYYLRRQDVTVGSERVWVEIRDKDSGITLERRPLTLGQDYEVNYLQGRVLLNTFLPLYADSLALVQVGSTSGNPVYLVVTYEYVPGLDAIDNLTTGIRLSHWVDDRIRLGFTHYDQGQTGADQRVTGIDLTLRYTPGTQIKAEIARSDGAGNGLLSSVDGGYGFNQVLGSGAGANAQRIEVEADLSDLHRDARGKVSGYYQHQDRNYSSPGLTSLNGEQVTRGGARISVPVTDALTIDAKADVRNADSQDYHAGEASARLKLNPEWQASLGLRTDSRDVRLLNASPTLSQDGDRTDVIARLDYQPLLDPADCNASTVLPKPGVPGVLTARPPCAEDWSAYGFVQGTAARSGSRSENNRAGLGGAWRFNERLSLLGEVSQGSGGLGGKIGADWRVDDRTNYYLQYAMETERPDLAYRGRVGNLVSGSRTKLSDEMSVFSETRWVNGAGPESLTQAFGVDLAPNDRWTLGGKFETGRVSDPLAGDFKRLAAGATAAYRSEDTKFATALELRTDDGATSSRRTWLMRNSLGRQMDPAWRLLAKVNFSFSDSTQGAFFDGDYVEGVLGAAYRPINNDRWNALFKYTYFGSVPSPCQLSTGSASATGNGAAPCGAGITADYAQRSHVLSVDTIYDVRPWLSLGVKYGLRVGEIKDAKVDGQWFSSNADLVVLRADWHWVREWDIVTEWRRLRVIEANDARAGALLAVYRHVDKNMKVGAGYNFTNFSDNLTDQSYRSRGWFINVLGTM